MRVHLVRKGHLGDVILTEPIARALKARGDEVVLVTEYTHAFGLMPTYDMVKGYVEYDSHCHSTDLETFIVLAYEIHPELHYVDAFAQCAGVVVHDRKPRIRVGFPSVVGGRYCLIAPHTSSWIRGMREWGAEAFDDVARGLRQHHNLDVIVLQPQHTFDEMLGLIEHCSLFIGNDSGPAIIAQSYDRPSLIIFGATDPSKVIFSPSAQPITIDVGCNGCRQWHRNAVVECNTPLCLDSVTSEFVLRRAEELLESHTVA
jgi:hypothetical protein